MRALTKVQRAWILERLMHNHKYAVVVLYAGTFPEKEALKFALVFRVAGWTVLGPFVDENICAEGLRIGVRDPHSPCPSAHLLVDVLVSAGMNVRIVKAVETLPSAFFDGCSVLLGPSRTPTIPTLTQPDAKHVMLP